MMMTSRDVLPASLLTPHGLLLLSFPLLVLLLIYHYLVSFFLLILPLLPVSYTHLTLPTNREV